MRGPVGGGTAIEAYAPGATVSVENTGARHLVRALSAHGVDTVFGLPGVHTLPIWEALRTSGIRLVTTRHEQAAAYAADGYARATGRVGVAIVTTGPGAANTLAAVGEARASGSPVVVIATDIPDALRRPGVYRGVLHENRDQRAMFLPVVKDGRTVRTARQIGPFLARAIELARTAPHGPVYLGVPTDFLHAVTPDDRRDVEPHVAPSPTRTDLARAASVLGRARRPLIWAGGGALRADAPKEVGRLAERLGAPVLTTYGARGLLGADNAWQVDATAHLPAAGRMWDEADVVLAVGTDFDAMTTQNWAMPRPPVLIAVNIDAADARKNYPADIVLVGDAKAVVADLAACFEGPLPHAGSADRDRDALRVKALARVREVNHTARATVAAEEPGAALLLDALADVAPEATLVADMCIAGYWVGGFARLPRPRSLAYPVGWGTLGFAFPAALGAASTGRRAIAVCGDGGFLFACGELATVAQERLPVTVVLVDDGGYGMLRYDQEIGGATPFGVDLVSPDFGALAAAFGVESRVVDDFGADFRETLAAFTAGALPNVLVVRAALAPPPNTSPRWYRRPPV